MPVAHGGGEVEERVDPVPYRCGVEQLRSDMRVKSRQVESRHRLDASDRRLGLTILDREPELRIGDAGADLAMRVDIDTRIDPDQDRVRRSRITCQLLKERDLVVVVDHDLADPGRNRLPQLATALVVAVQADSLGWHSPSQCDEEFTTGNNIQAKALIGKDPDQIGREECLAGIHDPRIRIHRRQTVTKPSGRPSQGDFVEDVQWGSVPRSQMPEIHPANLQRAVVLSSCGGRPRAAHSFGCHDRLVLRGALTRMPLA